MKKVTGSMLLASAITLGSIAAPSILAATTSNTATEEISEETKSALDEIRTQEDAGEITHEEAHEKMEALGIERPFGKGGPHGGGPFGNLDEETRTAIEDIRDQFKAGDLTEEEAQAKLDALDVNLPEDFLTHVNFDDLDEETKTALNEIREQLKAGTLTEEQAQAKVEALGLDFDFKILSRGHRMELTDEQKTQLDAIRDQVEDGTLTEEQAQTKLEELGLDFGPKSFRGFQQELTDEQKTQLEDIREQVEAGTLTEDEARTQMEELGLKPLGGPGRHGHSGPRGEFQPENVPADEEASETSATSEA